MDRSIIKPLYIMLGWGHGRRDGIGGPIGFQNPLRFSFSLAPWLFE